MPEDVVDELESLYRNTITSKIQESLDDHKYIHAYTSACGFWLLRAMLFNIMDKDYCVPSGPVPADSLWKPEQNLARPWFISSLEAFIKVSEKYDLLQNLRIAAKQMLTKVYAKWDDARPLDLYPAFKN